MEVVAALIFKTDRILLARRCKGSLAGYWEFPGGKVETNESQEQALARELFEEFGVEARIGAKILKVEHTGEKSFNLTGYWASSDSQFFELRDHDKIAWAKLEDLLIYNLAPADIPIAQEAIRLGIPNAIFP